MSGTHNKKSLMPYSGVHGAPDKYQYTLEPGSSNQSLSDDVSLLPPIDFLEPRHERRFFTSMITDCGLIDPLTWPILNFDAH